MADIASVLAERLVEKGIVTDTDETLPEGDEEGIEEEIDAEGESPEVGDDDSGDEESPDITNLVDLAKHLEVDPSFLYGLKIKLAETGEEVSIGSIKDRLQEAERSTRTVEKERSEISAERTAMVNAWSAWQSQQQQLDSASLAAKNEMLMAEAEFPILPCTRYTAGGSSSLMRSRSFTMRPGSPPGRASLRPRSPWKASGIGSMGRGPMFGA